MEPRPLTLTLAFALLLAADSPVLTLSLLLLTPPLLPQPPPPPPPRPPPPSPPPASPSSPVPTPSPLHQHMPRFPASPFWPPSPFAKSSDDQGAAGRGAPIPPPVSCAIVSSSACGWHPSSHGWSGRGSLHRVSELNLGKKVGLVFVAVLIVLQVVFGGFLIYKRRQIRRVGYQRDLASASPSALPSAS